MSTVRSTLPAGACASASRVALVSSSANRTTPSARSTIRDSRVGSRLGRPGEGADDVADLERAQPREPQRLGLATLRPAVPELGACRQGQQEPGGRQVADQLVHQLEGRRVQPLRVLQAQHHRSLLSQLLEQLDHAADGLALFLSGPSPLGRSGRAPGRMPSSAARTASEAGSGIPISGQPGGQSSRPGDVIVAGVVTDQRAQNADDRHEGTVAGQGGGLGREPKRVAHRWRLSKLVKQPRFSDARLASDHCQLAPSRGDPLPQGVQGLQLCRAALERRKTAAGGVLEARTPAGRPSRLVGADDLVADLDGALDTRRIRSGLSSARTSAR